MKPTIWERMAAQAAALRKDRLALNMLAAFASPIGLAFCRHTSLHEACEMGVGLAIAAFVAFIQHPEQREEGASDATASDKP